MRQILLLTLLLNSFLSNAQTRTITGKVIDEELNSLTGVRIHNKDTVILGTTEGGEFKIKVPTGTNELLLSFIGMEWTSIEVPQDCDKLEVIMMIYVNYHNITNKKIDRLRKKQFDKLPELHSKAIMNGLFTNKTQCFSRGFEPYKPRLDEISKEMKIKNEQNKETFKKLEIGDTVRIPFSGSYRDDGTDRTTLIIWSYVADAKDFECLIEGVVTKKDKRDGGYNFDYRVTNCKACKYDSIIYEKRDMVNGAVFRHNMKYFKVYTK